MNSTPSPRDASEAAQTLTLPENGTTASAEELRVQLVLALDQEASPEIDASQVDNVGQAVLQLLVAAQEEARASGRELIFKNASAAFRDRVERCRLTDRIGLQPQGAEA